ncbi:MAG: PLP-dependent aspartate aminotransferase family protein [Treponema sp.]|jgi:cystathionine gamma-synthase|nr:PLP-dependent aspartate aminotransferase family protein [Treponema sp.]
MNEEAHCKTYPQDGFSRSTLAVHGVTLFDPVTGAISTPIYQSSTFCHPGLGKSTGFDYSREVNPTRQELEKTIALLEKGKYGLAFSSGMGAISAVIKLFKPGSHLIMSEDLYGGTYRLFNDYYGKYGYSFSWVDTSSFASIEKALKSETAGLFIETPSNPMMKVTGIKGSAEFIHRHGGLLVVDNTFLSPWYQNPLELGADLVVHSGTKYLSGHNDTLSGFIVLSDPALEAELRTIQKSEGASLSPFDSWLTLRGIKTLGIRMEKHSLNAKRIASWLREQSLVEKVFYPGFEDHPQYRLSREQARGDGGMVSFYLKHAEDVAVLLRSVSLILFAESLGGVETLITYPLVQTHSAIPEAMRLSAGVNDRLIRLSVGIEDPEDLIADLSQAIETCKKERNK